MKKFFLILIYLLVSCFKSNGQADNNYIWLLGYPPNQPEDNLGGTMLDFNENKVSPKFINIYSALNEPAILSTNKGELLTYSNGCNIYNATHNLIEDGDTIGFGYIWEDHCKYGYPGTQEQLFLYWPGDSTKTILFHMKTEDNFLTNYLLYTIVDFSDAEHQGKVVEKDHLLINAGFSANIISCKHANGRDWWIVMPKAKTNKFYIMLLDPSGVSIVDTLSIGQPLELREWGGQAVFSPDGTKYIRYNPWKGLDIFDFDRSTGQLSNIRESGPFSDPVQVGGGAAVSLDSKYLYVSENINLYQFDLNAEDILLTKNLIATYDGYFNPFPTTFYQMLLAPDGKIYMTSTNAVKSIHVIEHPERESSACTFVQHGMELPTFDFIGSINMPFFRLGPDDGSIADTLGLNNLPIADFRYEIDTINHLEVHFNNLSYFLPDTYYWTFGNTTSSNLERPFPVVYQKYGEYEVCLTVANEYGSDTFCRNVILNDSLTSVEYSMDESGIEVYPNPFSSSISINFKKDFRNFSFELYSILGVPVYNSELHSGENKVSLPELSSGIYLYSLTTNGIPIKEGKIIKVE
ncbi:MAG TPA: T9SS type A sorting domain-containing protein [Saprospiraceae bacterium]|nr:T9SS type A sorting domain-containing protein [Saprospiraceae bacterium]